eukprot:CAMPEP_0204914846 /NCGR_PEP_ID=MMETSP1397-20131031/12771_1 /ASSEMBLY_ACC=CAM_ASM_000891 /TAXON_ID=49980 /ORGANISM="Climacostomum Climacostomum virens, Strain Stock W-24" /LENGTH=32 /DNA_ID= /DNA_START= /DNA_END= /DNA_ORIENTATION=
MKAVSEESSNSELPSLQSKVVSKPNKNAKLRG